MAVSEELLEILVCPKCKGEIHLNEKKTDLCVMHAPFYMK